MREGIRRNVDSLGRLTIPSEYRKLYDMEAGTKVSIIGTEEGILIYNPDTEKEKKQKK